MNIFFSQTKNQQGKSIVSTSQALASSLCQQLCRGCSSWRCILDQTQVTQPVIGRARRGAGLLSLSTTVFPKPSDFEMNEIYSMYAKQEFCSRCPIDRNVSFTCADICVLTLATLSSQCFFFSRGFWQVTDFNEQPKSSNAAISFVVCSLLLQQTGSQHLRHLAIRPDQVLITSVFPSIQ